jgi:hypothetical protein
MEIPLEIDLAMARAEDALNEAGVPFLLFVGHGNCTVSSSDEMLPENRDMLRRWIDDGHWNQVLRDLLDQHSEDPKPEACP